MIAEIASSFTALKSMSETVRLLGDIKTGDAVRNKAAELQSQIIALQSSLFLIQTQNQGLLREKEDLEQRIRNIKNWDAEKRRYELKEIATGFFVYAAKKPKESIAPSPWLCTNCYEHQHKSILQRGKQTYDGITYFCPNCKTNYLDHNEPLQPIAPFTY